MAFPHISHLLTSPPPPPPPSTQGRRVVRLKGGCPSVFARCSAELRALRSAGVEVEMVPGISSPLAAPLLAGFPLTDRDVGRQFAVATAHAPVSSSLLLLLLLLLLQSFQDTSAPPILHHPFLQKTHGSSNVMIRLILDDASSCFWMHMRCLRVLTLPSPFP